MLTISEIKMKSSTRFLMLFFILLFFAQCNNPKTEADPLKVHLDSNSLKQKSDTLQNQPEVILQSEITCPKCGYKKMEKLPTDICLIKYSCEKCGSVLFPKEGDCCVFCSYGNHKCPSKQ